MWTTARQTLYLTAILGGGGFLLQAAGLATYDAAAGTIDPHPISIAWLAGAIVGVVAPVVSALAVALKWGHK